MSFGDIRLGDTIDVKFSTAVNGVPTALSSGAVSAYVDNGTGEITAGVTLSADFDGLTGLNNVRVVASSGNGFATGTNVDLVLTGGTVGGSSVTGRQIDSFSIEKRSALMPTTAARTLDVSAGGEAGLDWANIGSPSTAQNLSATNIDVDQVVASVSGSVGSVASFGTLVADVATAVWAAGTRTLTSFGTLAADVWAVATRVLTAGTNIVLAKGVGVTGFNDLSAAQVNAEVDTALADYDGPTHAELVSEINDVQADIAALSIPSAGAVADAVWDEAIAGHLTAGTTGKALSDASTGGTAPTVDEIADEVETRAMTLTAAERNAIADAHLDRSNAIETGVTPRGASRLSLAALAGKLSGAATTTVTIRNAVADSKDRIVATVDVNGDRTAITTDQT